MLAGSMMETEDAALRCRQWLCPIHTSIDLQNFVSPKYYSFTNEWTQHSVQRRAFLLFTHHSRYKFSDHLLMIVMTPLNLIVEVMVFALPKLKDRPIANFISPSNEPPKGNKIEQAKTKRVSQD